MKLGARIFKTGLAVMLSLYLAIWLGFEPPTFAALAAAFAVQPSIYRTFQTILDQVQANVIGALLAVVLVMTMGSDPFIVGLAVVLAIALILKFKLEPTTIPIAVVTIIIIMESPSVDFIQFASSRFFLILLGVISAFIINLVFIPPRYETKLYQKLLKATEDIHQWMMLVIRHDADHRSLKNDISRLEEKMVKVDNLYLLYKEERNYFMRNKYAKARKVVVYRQMLVTTKKALFVLKNLEHRFIDINDISGQTHKMFEKQLYELTRYHELLFLRYIGKVNTERTTELTEALSEGKEDLLADFINLREQDKLKNTQWLHILPAISQLIEYQEQLEHLDQLLDSFLNYHQEENEVKIQAEEDI